MCLPGRSLSCPLLRSLHFIPDFMGDIFKLAESIPQKLSDPI